MKNPYCPKCGTQMDLRYGKFGPFWSCPLCHTTRNLDGTLPNWPVMIQKKINELHTLCETYICLLQLSSPINVTQSQILADKIISIHAPHARSDSLSKSPDSTRLFNSFFAKCKNILSSIQKHIDFPPLKFMSDSCSRF